jgi:hypothetical protein
MQYTLQICKSHEVNSVPRSWENLATGDEPTVLSNYRSWADKCQAAGDELRIVDEDGDMQCFDWNSIIGPMV